MIGSTEDYLSSQPLAIQSGETKRHIVFKLDAQVHNEMFESRRQICSTRSSYPSICDAPVEWLNAARYGKCVSKYNV